VQKVYGLPVRFIFTEEDSGPVPGSEELSDSGAPTPVSPKRVRITTSLDKIPVSDDTFSREQTLNTDTEEVGTKLKFYKQRASTHTGSGGIPNHIEDHESKRHDTSEWLLQRWEWFVS